MNKDLMRAAIYTGTWTDLPPMDEWDMENEAGKLQNLLV